MKKSLFFLLFVFSGLFVFAQKTSESVESFTKIDVFGPFKVELIKAEKAALEMDTRGIDRENIVVEVRNDELRLKVRSRHFMNEWSTYDYPRSQVIKVRVYYVELKALEAQAGAVVFSNDIIKSKNFAIECSMGAEVRLDVVAKNLFTKVSMGGELDLEGRVEMLDVKANMGGVLRASGLESKSALVDATMGAEVMVRATQEIEVSAGFGATVQYTGEPTVRHTSKNFGAEVRGN